VSGRLGGLVAALALLSVVVLVAAFSAGGGDGGGAAPAAAGSRVQPTATPAEARGLPTAEGVLTAVLPGRLVLQPYTEDPPATYLFEGGQVAADIAHLRLHVEDGTPVRLFYEQRDGDRIARAYEDLLPQQG